MMGITHTHTQKIFTKNFLKLAFSPCKETVVMNKLLSVQFVFRVLLCAKEPVLFHNKHKCECISNAWHCYENSSDLMAPDKDRVALAILLLLVV